MDWSRKNLRRLDRLVHRDLGYFISMLLITYSISGVALNHIDVWNPDFDIEKRQVTVPAELRGGELTPSRVVELSRLVGQEGYRVFDVPAPGQVKIYYDKASLHVHLAEGKAAYERISRRPFFYQVNVLHRNSFKPWRWIADAFALVLIVITLSGLFAIRGKNGFSRRGKWLMLAGALPPVVALVLHG